MNSCAAREAETRKFHALLLTLLQSTSEPPSQNLPGWAIKLKTLLHDRWCEVVPLDESAQELGVHPVTISKSFARYFGCTYGTYLRKLKIERSIPLVKDPRLSLTQVALRCGFSDQSHFTRSFKEATGLLPRDVRRN